MGLSEPKDCPKCGSRPDIERDYCWVVYCSECAMNNDGEVEALGQHLHDKGLAIEAWNASVNQY